MDELEELFARKDALDETITDWIRDNVFEGDQGFQQMLMERDQIEERINELIEPF